MKIQNSLDVLERNNSTQRISKDFIINLFPVMLMAAWGVLCSLQFISIWFALDVIYNLAVLKLHVLDKPWLFFVIRKGIMGDYGGKGLYFFLFFLQLSFAFSMFHCTVKIRWTSRKIWCLYDLLVALKSATKILELTALLCNDCIYLLFMVQPSQNNITNIQN